MKLKITAIRDAGDLKNERVVMKATESADVGNFVLFCTGFHNGEVTIDVKRAYWFPFKKVSVGDFVVVYTKAGTDSAKEFNQVKSHFFYWGNSSTVWDQQQVSAVLLHAPEWESFQEKS